jgi:hypothetical protein
MKVKGYMYPQMKKTVGMLKSAKKSRHNETKSTTEDKDGDNSDNLSHFLCILNI